jgi:hypothetical protein
MPTVAAIRGFPVVIHTNDHPPANVHVIGPDCEAVFILHCPHGRSSCARSTGAHPSNCGG